MADAADTTTKPERTRGAFILFEGVDRCGKTTQAKKLVAALNAANKRAEFIRFPDREASTGRLINEYLVRNAEINDQSVHLLFSANRWEKRDDIVSMLNAGTHVVADRYAYSGVAFSSAKPGLDLEWCMNPDTGLPMPDTILYMDLSVDAAADRPEFGGERYENPEFQKRVRARFEELQRSEPGPDGKNIWRIINAAGTIDAIHAQILQHVNGEIIPAVAGQPIGLLWNGTGGINRDSTSSIHDSSSKSYAYAESACDASSTSTYA